MLNAPSTVFFDHSRHKLWISELDTSLDVLVFTGTERLSEPFSYQIEFTSTDQDIAVERVLNRQASFSLYAAPKPLLKAFPGFPEPEIKPLRTLHGVITGFQRLSGSNDEARYAVTLEPRLALLGRGKQTRIYQHQSVPQIVEKVLRSRHEFLGQDFYFNVVREYPPRLQVMQYDESDLAFITRLLAEVGIWFRFATDERLRIEVVEFHDDQRHYLDPRPSLPSRPPSGLSGGDQDAVWALQASHQVVEQRINFRAYDPRKATAWLDGEVDQTRGATTTYGEAYHYAEAYTELGGKLDQDEDLLSESGFFYARLRHERYLNEQTRLSGTSNSATLALAQVLEISGSAPQAFAPGAVITSLTLSAARDTSLLVNFEAIPYVETVCFRPPLQKKPSIAGTLPARVTSNRANDPYSHINLEGRYKVSFLFDRDEWKQGEESLWLRLARPYAGDTHGLHLPLICGTEVAIAFEQGDPDRPYIAHALHDNKHPDHVTLARRDYKRNVLRTPANNKLRMEDERGQEHIKLSTEHSGKSQLNLGHLVDAQKQKRGEGFELRTDGWGAIRGGKGLFITAEERPKATSRQLDMTEAIRELESALSLARSMAQAARSSKCTAGDSDSQSQLTNALTNLTDPGLLLHAPAGIGLVSPEAICVASGRESIGLMSAHQTDISAGTSITATAEEAISLCAKKAGLQLKAAQGDVELHAQRGSLHALANTDIKIESVAGRVEITAPNELLLSCGGAYIRIKDGEIELGAPNNLTLKVAHVDKFRGTTLDTPVTPIPDGYSAGYTLSEVEKGAAPFTRYQITTQWGEVFKGATDKAGKTMPVHMQLPGKVEIEFPEKVQYDEQLQLVDPDGNAAAEITYALTLADGSVFKGETDQQGFTQRIVTEKSTQLALLSLTPSAKGGPICCAAQNAQAQLDIDLKPEGISTNENGFGTSIHVLPLPKGKKRNLTPGEIAMAKTVFKDAIDYHKVKVHRGGWWLFLGFQNTAVTPNGEMYFPDSTGYYRDDYSTTKKLRDKALFMHEMTHVWQYQLGYAVKSAGITVTSRGAQAYRYLLDWTMRLRDYNMEQQGEIISDYYMICIERSPADVWNYANADKDPELLKAVLKDFLADASAKNNLPK